MTTHTPPGILQPKKQPPAPPAPEQPAGETDRILDSINKHLPGAVALRSGGEGFTAELRLPEGGTFTVSAKTTATTVQRLGFFCMVAFEGAERDGDGRIVNLRAAEALARLGTVTP